MRLGAQQWRARLLLEGRPSRACFPLEGLSLVFGVGCPRGGLLPSPAQRAGDGHSTGSPVLLTAPSAATAGCSTSTSQYPSTPPRLAGRLPAASSARLDDSRLRLSTAWQYVTRIRGAGESEKEGVLRHESAPRRRLTPSPGFSILDRRARDSPSTSPSSPPHTLEGHGYMDVGEAGGEAVPRPPVDKHDVDDCDSARPAARFSRSWLRSAEARACFNSFAWPLRSRSELLRLLSSRVLAPTCDAASSTVPGAIFSRRRLDEPGTFTARSRPRG